MVLLCCVTEDNGRVMYYSNTNCTQSMLHNIAIKQLRGFHYLY